MVSMANPSNLSPKPLKYPLEVVELDSVYHAYDVRVIRDG